MRNKISEFLTDQEIKDLLRQPDRQTFLGKRDFLILKLMILTGLRRAEICGLRRGDLMVSGDRAYLKILGKGQKVREIRIADPEVLSDLVDYFKKVGSLSNPEAPMFFTASQRGGHQIRQITPETIRRIVEKYVRLAKIPKRITPHSLRHTFLTQALKRGADLATVQGLAGHSNIQTTSRYLHTTQEDMDKAIERLRF